MDDGTEKEAVNHPSENWPGGIYRHAYDTDFLRAWLGEPDPNGMTLTLIIAQRSQSAVNIRHCVISTKDQAENDIRFLKDFQ